MSPGATSRFHNPVRIQFGRGALNALPEVVGGRRCIVVTSEGMERRGSLSELQAILGDGVTASYAGVTPNPTVLSCSSAHEALRDAQGELLVAFGGGSVIDTAKAVAAQRAVGMPGWLAAHLRDGEPIPSEFEPPTIVAIPTTAGTGSEVTMWGTIWDEETGGKHSISHPRLYPETAVLDPRLTLSTPPETTSATALDALSHAMEAIWNRASNPVSDGLAARAISVIPRMLPRALDSPADLDAREALLGASLLAGLAISSTRTALAHSISYPLTAEMGLPHGFACSLTLAEILTDVAGHFPDRAELIVNALGARDIQEAVELLYALFQVSGTREQLQRHLPDARALTGLRGNFIAPGRAENYVAPVDQDAAVALLQRAHATICAREVMTAPPEDTTQAAKLP